MNTDAISDQFRHDPKAKRYRWRKGTPGAGQLVSNRVIESMLEAQVNRLGNELVATSETAYSDLRQWQQDSGAILKRLHGSMAVLAHGGHQNMSDADWLTVARNLKAEYINGVYTNAEGKRKRYGLKLLAREIKQGKVSEGRLRQRLRMYANNARKAYFAAREAEEIAKGNTHCYRKTTPGEICPDCVRYEKMGVVKIGGLPLPGHGSRCGPNCRCQIIYTTLEEMVKGG